MKPINYTRLISFAAFILMAAPGCKKETITDSSPDVGVIFYENINYKGASTISISKGHYSFSQLKKYGFKKKWVSSVKIPTGWIVRLQNEDDSFELDDTWYPIALKVWQLHSSVANFRDLQPNANDAAIDYVDIE